MGNPPIFLRCPKNRHAHEGITISLSFKLDSRLRGNDGNILGLITTDYLALQNARTCLRRP
jgi:hypothetical protein